jgi:hypothetical protein
MKPSLNPRNLYRLPWNYSDNGISWLEPTSVCNVNCEGCYRETSQGRHKTMDEVRADLETFRRLRKSDCISISGGDPLVHPHIVEIVRLVHEMGWKPIINTNGLALTEELLPRLKSAGAFGFTFHVDTSQKRPHIRAETEADLNPLRLHYAQMLKRAGGLACSFNATVSEKTLKQMPDVIRWAQMHPSLVHTLVFILYRSPNLAGEDFHVTVGEKRIGFGTTYKESSWGAGRPLDSAEMIGTIMEADPRYEPSAYLNGTADTDSLKWVLATRVIFNGKTIGYTSPRFQELLQTVYHLFKGRYYAYANPKFCSRGKSSSFLMGFSDKKMASLYRRILAETARNPLAFFKPAYFQSFMIIQPINIKPDGSQDMCDGCPDMTVFNDRLVWSCRLEELNLQNRFFSFVPKTDNPVQ